MCYEVLDICMQGSETKHSDVLGKDPIKPESSKSKLVPLGADQSVCKGMTEVMLT